MASSGGGGVSCVCRLCVNPGLLDRGCCGTATVTTQDGWMLGEMQATPQHAEQQCINGLPVVTGSNSEEQTTDCSQMGLKQTPIVKLNEVVTGYCAENVSELQSPNAGKCQIGVTESLVCVIGVTESHVCMYD